MVDSERELDIVLREKAVLDRYASGDSVVVIAMDLGVTVQTVHRAIKKAAEEIRASNQDRVNAALLQQDLGLTRLIQICMSRLAFEGKFRFDSESIRCLIMVYDRQAKLHGLDRAKLNAPNGSYSWLETASPQLLMETAAKMGIRVPVPFAGSDS